MKILFVNYHHLDSNSGVHIFNLANQLVGLGVDCVVGVPFRKDLTTHLGTALFETVEFPNLLENRGNRIFDLIHAWTPREGVRKITQALKKLYICPYVVHLEDNEEIIIEAVSRIPTSFLKYVPNFLTWLLLPGTVSHPLHYKEFLAGAGGITFIVDALKEFCPPHLPNQVVWAGYQEDMGWNRPPDLEYKRHLGISENEFVVVYTGNVHLANQQEVSDLYRAIEIVNKRGFPLRLIRTGIDYAPLPLGNLKTIRKNYCVELGRIPRGNLPSLLSIADILVQPGMPGLFNDYRFPSKLPEYLASGKPVILPKTNIGLFLKDREECLLLDRGDVSDIVDKIKILLSDVKLRNQIGAGGRIFADRNLRWDSIAGRLYAFYKTLLSS